jgi:EamA domain-containing membrane protein RarD
MSMEKDKWVERLRAVVRPTLALAGCGIFGYLAVTAKLPVEATVGILTMVFTFYFVHRHEEKPKPSSPSGSA